MWPVLTDVQADSKGYSATMYWTTVPVTLTEAELDSVACTGSSSINKSCSLGVYYRLDADRFGYSQDLATRQTISSIASAGMGTTVTWRQIFAENQFTPGSEYVTAPNHSLRESCFRIGISKYTGTWSATITWAAVNNQTSVPPGIAPVSSGECIGTPPDDEWCAPETINLDFDFGTIRQTSASGTQRSKDITVRCTTDMKFKLFMQQQNATAGSISLNNGMEGILSINGEALSDSIQQGTDGTVNIPLTVTLTGEPESEGTFTGSGVVGISYP